MKPKCDIVFLLYIQMDQLLEFVSKRMEHNYSV